MRARWVAILATALLAPSCAGGPKAQAPEAGRLVMFV